MVEASIDLAELSYLQTGCASSRYRVGSPRSKMSTSRSGSRFHPDDESPVHTGFRVARSNRIVFCCVGRGQIRS